jgi:hypothetical protein
LRSTGPTMYVVGADPVDLKSTQAGNGTITVKTEDGGNRWSHLQNNDSVDVVAEFSAAKSQYKVVIQQVMPRHNLGQYTTWSGVVYDAEMHGDTGIGTSKLPKVTPEIALWGYAQVHKDGTLIAKAAPAHVMVMKAGPVKGIMLEVETEAKGLLGTPDGYLNVMWHEIASLRLPEDQVHKRQIVGWLALLAVTGLFGWLAWREQDRS